MRKIPGFNIGLKNKISGASCCTARNSVVETDRRIQKDNVLFVSSLAALVTNRTCVYTDNSHLDYSDTEESTHLISSVASIASPTWHPLQNTQSSGCEQEICSF